MIKFCKLKKKNYRLIKLLLLVLIINIIFIKPQQSYSAPAPQQSYSAPAPQPSYQQSSHY